MCIRDSAKARECFAAGDYRWVAELVNHLIFADPDNAEAKELQARALEQLGYGAENGTWRNFYLMGAHELRNGASGTATRVPPDFIASMPTSQLLDAIAIQIDGPRAADASLSMIWILPDVEEAYQLTMTNGVLTYRPNRDGLTAEATLTVERSTLNDILLGAANLEELVASGRVKIDGEQPALARLLGLLDPPDPNFAIVTP